jgi:HD-GYP domain-containing protein (c-di-GMP phosphodiesterase class II)
MVVDTGYKDEETGDHIVRIGRLAALLSERLDLPDTYCPF